MANERRIRLIQVAKEFNVGINTITDFLQKKGVKSDGSPNALVDAGRCGEAVLMRGVLP